MADPARAGLPKAALSLLLDRPVGKLVYVSCNPPTQASCIRLTLLPHEAARAEPSLVLRRLVMLLCCVRHSLLGPMSSAARRRLTCSRRQHTSSPLCFWCGAKLMCSRLQARGGNLTAAHSP